MEKTLIIIKPDSVSRKLAGEIISRFEKKNFTITKLKMCLLSKNEAEKFYAAHIDKPFFADLVKFITSDYIISAVLEGEHAITTVRQMIGSTKSYEANSGTIRGDFGLGITNNVIHASDSLESFITESNIIFPD
jgi:nucleoside-diphosphate kinase